MPEKIEELLERVEEVIDNGDWPTGDEDHIMNLIHDIRYGENLVA